MLYDITGTTFVSHSISRDLLRANSGLRNNMDSLSFLSCTAQQTNAIQDLLISRLSEYSLPYRAAHYVRGHRHIQKASYLHKTTQTCTQVSSGIRTHNDSVRAAADIPHPKPPEQEFLSLLQAFLDTITTETHKCVGDEAFKVRNGVKRKRLFIHKTRWPMEILKLLLLKPSGWT